MGWISFIESSENMISQFDTHMNENGHRKFSNYLYDSIKEIRNNDRNNT